VPTTLRSAALSAILWAIDAVATTPKARFRLSWLNLVVMALCLAALAWIIITQHDQLGRSIAGVAHAKIKLVIVAFFCERVSMFALARMQRRLLRTSEVELSLQEAIGISLAGNALSVSVPLAGPGLSTAYSYREFARRQISRHSVVVALVLSGVLSTVSLMVIVAVGALVSGNTVAGILGLVGVLAIMAGIGAVVLFLRVEAFRRLLERLAVHGVRLAHLANRRFRRKTTKQSPEAVVAEARAQVAELRLSHQDWAAAIGLAFVNWLADAACLYFSIRAARLAVPAHDILLVWSAGVGASSIGLTPGGIGVVEVALVGALVALKVPAAGATVAVMIYRLLSLWLVVLVGWVVFFVLRSKASRG
jgi:putative heme transporter